MERNWQSLLEPILKEAGALLLSYYNKPLTKESKKDGSFVTPADIASETFLIQNLSALMPEAGIWSEEAGRKNSDNAYCWVIDPLDGTTNFAHGLPYFCISVALTHHNVPIVSGIYQPITDEFFYAERNKGAFLNHKPIQVSAKKLENAVIAIGLSYRHVQALSLLTMGKNIIKNAYAVRHIGTLALDLAYIACGKLDGLFFSNLHWWDFAAGILLVEEAQGIVTNLDNQQLIPTDLGGIIGGKLVHNALHSLLLRE